MTPDEFCRWLQGFCELSGEKPTEKQWQAIVKHLESVYVKVTDKKDVKAAIEELRKLPRGPGPTRYC